MLQEKLPQYLLLILHHHTTLNIIIIFRYCSRCRSSVILFVPVIWGKKRSARKQFFANESFREGKWSHYGWRAKKFKFHLKKFKKDNSNDSAMSSSTLLLLTGLLCAYFLRLHYILWRIIDGFMQAFHFTARCNSVARGAT